MENLEQCREEINRIDRSMAQLFEERMKVAAQIAAYKKEHGRDIPDNILIQVVDSKDPGKIIKQGDKSGLHNALTMGMIWLDRANRS